MQIYGPFQANLPWTCKTLVWQPSDFSCIQLRKMSNTTTLPAELVTKGVAFWACAEVQRCPKYPEKPLWLYSTMYHIQALAITWAVYGCFGHVDILDPWKDPWKDLPSFAPAPSSASRRGDRWVWAAAWTLWTKMSTTGSPNRFESGDAKCEVPKPGMKLGHGLKHVEAEIRGKGMGKAMGKP